jgi:hypothetical protein
MPITIMATSSSGKIDILVDTSYFMTAKGTLQPQVIRLSSAAHGPDFRCFAISSET